MQTSVPSTPGTSPRPRLSLPRGHRRPGSRPAAEKLASLLASIDCSARHAAKAGTHCRDAYEANGDRAQSFVAGLAGAMKNERPELAAAVWALISDKPLNVDDEGFSLSNDGRVTFTDCQAVAPGGDQ